MEHTCVNCKKILDAEYEKEWRLCEDCRRIQKQDVERQAEESQEEQSDTDYFNLWDDDTGIEINERLKGLAKFMIGLAWLFVFAGILTALIMYDASDGESIAWWSISGGIAVGGICYLGGVNMLWRSALGDNVLKIRQQCEKNK